MMRMVMRHTGTPECDGVRRAGGGKHTVSPGGGSQEANGTC